MLFLVACNSKKTGDTALFSKMDNTGIQFINTVTDNEIENSFNFRNFYNGGGVAIGDINNDSLPDIMFTSNMGENKLYLNKGNFKFEDISVAAGLKQDSLWNTGVTFVDINNDGWLDMYVCSSGNMRSGKRRNKLYINNHHLGFTDSAAAYGLDHSGFSTQSVFFDYDLDGDLDCFLINNSPLPFSSIDYGKMRDKDISEWKVDETLRGGGNHLFQNTNGHFTEVTKAAGLHSGLISFGLGVSVSDINNDGYPDIYVGNDFIEKDYCYINQKNGTFKDELEDRFQKISMSSMSSDAADINNDGYPDIFTTDMIPDDDYRLKTTGTFDNIDLYNSKQKAGLYHQFVKNCLQLNNRNGSFSEIGNFSAVSGTDWSWGAVFLDADNDGLNDLFVCNGINKDVGDLDYLDFFSDEVYSRMLKTGEKAGISEVIKHIPVHPLPNRVFKNMGDLKFNDVGSEWGFSQPSFSNSVAYADLDNDGDLDLVVNNENQESFVYRNNARAQNGNGYIGFMFSGGPQNRFAVGSRILVYRGAEILSREVFPSRGFQSSMDYKQVIGLGTGARVDSVVVIWPNRTSTRYNNLALNQVHYLQQPLGIGPLYSFAQPAFTPLLVADSMVHMDKHTEDDYTDFYYERNLPEQLSKEGPKIAHADVNGDGLEDVYIGGAKGTAGQLYIQTTAGGYMKQAEPVFTQFADLEDVAVLFFDADKDGDMDLFIGAGGNNVEPNNREIQHRLYKNDGHGHFTLDGSAFPNNNMNIAVAVNYDYDGDGDEDLFVGSRSVPFNYGLTPQSYMYRNDGNGHFTELSAEQCGGISTAGMITGAVWADMGGDKRKELVLTGEWMAPRIYSYNATKQVFEPWQHTQLENLSGWWQSIAAVDVNGDGLMDLMLGNVGENFYLRPDAGHPVRLWTTDFDNNGTAEQFITRTIGDKDMPVFLKREITDQFPGLKKKNLKHSDYATKSIQDLFDKAVLDRSGKHIFNECRSMIAVNDGHGGFKLTALPYQAQLSSINAICVVDINGDGHKDLVMGGNLFEFPPQFGRLDGSYGVVLLGDGKGGMRWTDAGASGLNLRGSVKDIAELNATVAGKRRLLITRNNDTPVMMNIEK